MKEVIVDDPVFKIILNKTILSAVNSSKSLGLMLDSDLRFSSHVSSLIQKSYAKLKILYMHKGIFDTNIKLRLSDSLVLSHLSYCDVVFWPALTQRDRESLQKLQNACLRFSYGVRKFDHISPPLHESGWLTIEERFQLHMCCLTYKVDILRMPSYLYEKLKRHSDLHGIHTRNREMYSVPKHNFQFFKRSFSYVSVDLFNSLPSNIRSSTTLNAFREKARQFLLAKRS